MLSRNTSVTVLLVISLVGFQTACTEEASNTNTQVSPKAVDPAPRSLCALIELAADGWSAVQATDDWPFGADQIYLRYAGEGIAGSDSCWLDAYGYDCWWSFKDESDRDLKFAAMKEELVACVANSDSWQASDVHARLCTDTPRGIESAIGRTVWQGTAWFDARDRESVILHHHTTNDPTAILVGRIDRTVRGGINPDRTQGPDVYNVQVSMTWLPHWDISDAECQEKKARAERFESEAELLEEARRRAQSEGGS